MGWELRKAADDGNVVEVKRLLADGATHRMPATDDLDDHLPKVDSADLCQTSPWPCRKSKILAHKD